jgi:hypothetical protein
MFRYRLMPTFGAETIRRFSKNVSEMKKMAARDFENLLLVRVGSYILFQFLIEGYAVCHPCI